VTRKRDYSVEQANRTLPYVGTIVRELMERYARIQSLSKEHHDTPRDHAEKRGRMRALMQEEAAALHACHQELQALGIELKDYEMGLVDFPARIEGRTIHLCWKHGEPEIGHWHEVDAGFRGRHAVPAGEPGWPHKTTAAPASQD